MKKPFAQVEWDEAADAYMIELYFETAPPGYQECNLALGRHEMTELIHALQKARQRKLLGKNKKGN